MTLERARERMGAKLVLPSDANANQSNVKSVAICGSGTDHSVVVFTNGVWLTLDPYSGTPPDWKSWAADDPVEAKVASIRDKTVLLITPGPQRRGSVTFTSDGRQFVVIGNGKLTSNELLAIAASIPTGEGTG